MIDSISYRVLTRAGRFCLVTAFLGVQSLLAQATEIDGPEEAPSKVSLISSDFPGEAWKFVSGKKGAPFSETWSLATDEEANLDYIICRGQPYGYIRTKKIYSDFEFSLEWRFPKDENGNSGVLLFTTGEDRVWPTAVQVQLHQPVAGSIFPGGSAKSANEVRNVEMLARPVNQWNKCFIRCQNGTVTVTINDTAVGEVTECDPQVGAIGLQSEGSEVHFRKIWVRELKAPQEVEAIGAKAHRPRRKLKKLARQLTSLR
ncbi:hypothetical protein KOR42_01280 [Thalassoglobus neptunius]|uniref:3-keto-alpha-glucoside-1,2-lyase/3-keto-2-hydroxy-glucal hydratase domain-containing protein n=1 Tax=Thalassoglobus neptunius TaxID=1938619 RepID=A0A5C5X3J1_9PLAN|nr:DUF1080 domain-containing protein [Thalassoglobus neptunius]TWT56773.1 hypothetical protein KOR42_01280 [Thalassoglobus neptunius]